MICVVFPHVLHCILSLILFPLGELEAFWISLKDVEQKYLNHEQYLLTP
jgi:hypothetical protein